MLSFIAFGFKILFSAVIGGIIGYFIDSSSRNIVTTSSIVCILSSSILSFTNQVSHPDNQFVIGAGILGVLIIVNSLFKTESVINYILYLLSSISGMIIGIGFIFQAFLLSSIIIIIIKNNNAIISYIDNNRNHNDEKM
tara:strand:- start:245 stop:661 length:417 start_codon:yes stop_codon:yes gene_type:complete